MIKANDLRLGNIVQRPEHLRIDMLDGGDIYFRVNSTMIRDCEHYKEDWAFEPIELTPEMLGKVKGCEHDTTSEYGGYCISVSESEKIRVMAHPLAGFGWQLYNDTFVKLTHLHQLQNLYYALTGTELSITL